MNILSIVMLVLCLTGCWNSKELPDLGFVMGVSLDLTEDGMTEMNMQVYSPEETIGGGGSGGDTPQYTNIKIVSESVFAGVRDITRHLGRKAEWSHMRVILIGEQFVKEQNIGEILEFFTRDHEVRLTSLAVITEGKASDYLEVPPFIERTVSQKLRTIVERGEEFSAKTIKSLLLDVTMELNKKVKVAMVSRLQMTEDKPQIFSNGVAVISKGKMVDKLSSEEVQNVLILTDQFEDGIIEFSCLEERKETRGKESLEVLSVTTSTSSDFIEKPFTVEKVVKIEGIIGEIKCTTITTEEELKKVEDHITKTVKADLEAIIERLQEKKVDVLGIGNQLYQQAPALWKQYEQEWDDIFADTRFTIDVEVHITGTGMPTGEKVMEE
ncbi:Ger(x)C family spore germination protein [Salipaludibacillus sp. CF4.18]|uniref:Ger(x)C family spore germination protein n=1 Tax=Salipaludibacillus sp. CF4.18 TaxID=3373081 RepID=UPI003EE673FD